MRTVHVNTSTPYDVLIGSGLIDRSGELTAKAVKPCQCVIVTDSNVDELYGDRAQISFSYAGFEVSGYVFPAGEENKNLRTLGELLETLAERRMTRGDLIVALGGGVTGDMAGFAAAVYCRGIRFVQIPTTLLAAVDSSVGGKTAVDLRAGKNLAGSFHQPSLVITDTDILRELPDDILSCGAAEAVKAGVLNDPGLFALLETGDWRDQIDEVVVRCVTYKRDAVIGDEFDTGARAFLNLGHTFGHAIEKCANFGISHGEGVAIGMVMAATSAGCDETLVRRLAACLRANGLPTRCGFDAGRLADAALSDKKRSGGTITLVLPEAVGKCCLRKVPVSELKAWFERALAAQEALNL